jgi:hypothetical protein
MYWIVRTKGDTVEYYMGGNNWSDSMFQAKTYDSEMADALINIISGDVYKIPAF